MLDRKNPDQRINPEREREMLRQLQELARQWSHKSHQSKESQDGTLKNNAGRHPNNLDTNGGGL